MMQQHLGDWHATPYANGAWALPWSRQPGLMAGPELQADIVRNRTWNKDGYRNDGLCWGGAAVVAGFQRAVPQMLVDGERRCLDVETTLLYKRSTRSPQCDVVFALRDMRADADRIEKLVGFDRRRIPFGRSDLGLNRYQDAVEAYRQFPEHRLRPLHAGHIRLRRRARRPLVVGEE